MNDRMYRWCYRRMAWKNDQHLFMEMHPRLAWLVDRLYEPSWPIREWFYDMCQAACNKQKTQAIRDVYGYRDTELRCQSYDGTAREIYATAREQGWTGKKNSVHPYTRRELLIQRLQYGFGHPVDSLDRFSDEALYRLLQQELARSDTAKKARQC